MHVSNDLPNSKIKLLIVLVLLISHSRMIFAIIHIMTNNIKTLARIDYVFINFETEYDSMQSTQISISDHLLLHVFVKPSNLYQRGSSYWKLNEEV